MDIIINIHYIIKTVGDVRFQSERRRITRHENSVSMLNIQFNGVEDDI